MDLVDRLNTTSYLGREFLTWLWFKSDTQEGLISLGEDGPAIELFLTDRIVLSGAGQGAERVTIRTEDPSLSYEARTALQQGKKVEKGTLRIVSGQREWTVTVDGETLAVSSVKIPALLTRENDEKFHERLALIDQLDSMILALFQSFLAVRTDDTRWSDEFAQMKVWVKEDTIPDRFQMAPVHDEPGDYDMDQPPFETDETAPASEDAPGTINDDDAGEGNDVPEADGPTADEPDEPPF